MAAMKRTTRASSSVQSVVALLPLLNKAEISTVMAMRILKSPLKNCAVSLVPHLVAAAIPAFLDEEKKEAREHRETVHGFSIGTLFDIVVSEDGSAKGHGAEPSNAAVNSGKSATDFAARQPVWVWWWGFLWRATIQHLAPTRNRVAVRWEYNHSVTCGYLARLVFPRD